MATSSVVWIASAALGVGFGLGVAYMGGLEDGHSIVTYAFGAFIGLLVGATIGFVPWLILAVFE